jgi:tRNA pseudouridine38-40 synthase
MTIIKLVVAYDGTDFHGWAKQPSHRTVEGELERAVGRVTGRAPKLSVAGRTDAGVHARGQVVSFHSDADPEEVLNSVNGALAPEVVVLRASLAPGGFDARFSATAREYRYRIDVGSVPDPFTARYVWHKPVGLSLAEMRQAARSLAGDHDFASFGRLPKDGGGTVRDLQRLTVTRVGDRIEIVARANAFMRQMVRSLVGTLVDCGEGRIAAGTMADVIAAKDRARAGRLAPSHGLTLERVVYGGRSPVYSGKRYTR